MADARVRGRAGGARRARPRRPGSGSPSGRSPRSGRSSPVRRGPAAGERGRRTRPTRRRRRTARRGGSTCDDTNARTTSAIHACPSRTSPCGCSSAEIPSPPPPSRNGGSTNETFGSVPERAVRVVLRQRPRPRRAARAPDRRERQVGVVVAGVDAAAQRPVEDRLPLVAGGLQRRRVVLAPARLRRPLVVAVRPGRRQHRAEEAVVDRELLRGRVDELDVALVVVGQRELVVAAPRGEEPAARAARAPAPSRAPDPDARSPATRPPATRRGASEPARRKPRPRTSASDPRPRRRASRSSGRTTGSPSSRRRCGRSAGCAATAARRRCAAAASAISVPAGNDDSPARPATEAVRARKSRRRRVGSSM